MCLDAECGDYERLWLSSSLRGLLIGTLEVAVLTEGVHSGAASGIVPSSFRILRSLLDRLEDATTGRVIDALHVPIDAQTQANARELVDALGDMIVERYPWQSGITPMAQDMVELVLNNTWRPTLSVTGLSGAPPVTSAGNTLRPSTSAKLSIRLPPTLDGNTAGNASWNLVSKQTRRTARTSDSCRTAANRAGPRRSRSGAPRRRLQGASIGSVFRKARPLHGDGRHDPLPENVGRPFSRTRSSWSPACSDRTRTRTARTNSSTSKQANASRACVAHVLANYADGNDGTRRGLGPLRVPLVEAARCRRRTARAGSPSDRRGYGRC